jgi:hypothetical protein
MLEEVKGNMMSQQVMNKYSDHDFIVSQSLYCGEDKSITSKQNSTNLMT